METKVYPNQADLVIVLTGPTGSGKSELSLRLAKALDGEIISADSMQIYRSYNIGTAKLPEDQREGIPHYLLDILDPTETYSVSDFVRDATALIKEIQLRNKTAIVCGGTNQYLSALLDGLEFIEIKADPELRENISQRVLEMGLDQAHKHLSTLDEEAGQRIKPQDFKRITRFFEVYEQTGLTQSEVYRRSRLKGPDFHFRAYALMPEREKLYDAINKRTRKMFSHGLVQELEALLLQYPDLETTQSFQAIGYKEVLPYLKGELTKEESIELLARNTRRYAKRQLSWIHSRDDLIEITEMDVCARLTCILQDLNSFRQNIAETEI